jgi:hypothetical protein
MPDKEYIGRDPRQCDTMQATTNQCGPTREWIVDQLFTYHQPNPTQVQSLGTIRETAKFLAQTILANTPRGADQTAAIRLLRECVMTANAAIVLDGASL